jgi:hypothetical protein
MLDYTNVKTNRTNVEALNKEEAIILCMDKLQIMQENKRNGTSKEEECHNPALAKCGGEAQHFQSWGFGVLRDSRMFRVR